MGEKCCQSKKSLNESENTQAVKKVVYLNADTMGRDDDGLGAVLMTAFLESLNHSVNEFSHISQTSLTAELIIKIYSRHHNLSKLCSAGMTTRR